MGGGTRIYGYDIVGTKKMIMNTCKVFPEWLYDYIFVQLGAKERPNPIKT